MTLALVQDVEVDVNDALINAKTPTETRKSRKAVYWRKRRAELSATALDRLDDAGIVLPLFGGMMTIPEICDYFGISRSALTNIARANYTELIDVGYMPGSVTRPTRYSEMAIIHVAMILRSSTSDQAAEIQKALGMFKPPRTAKKRHISAAHIKVCGRILDEAYALISDIREQDPEEVWRDLDRRSRHDLQMTAVALASLIPADQGGLRAWLSRLGMNLRSSALNKAAVGLASLVPSRQEIAE
ncbi:hypothetical protein [Mycobacteroides abscessus]|uniref:hypothetical protein n=1 Tax=Mycobacteroides abscessus TaxID=36809 RepID=UPI00092A42DF|nr:hypothetical protein [Mycobacteroides abscessus]DAZ90298.1 TPA_asm: hypothetical protein PROPHIFSQJ01-1_12 [Mycobacterium phage prophiFSQJ01-1]SII40235.1 Uncharacterised protein [Mycobacteroides abscessus subsp. abscessus]SIK15036.1 Uncharacterised protein [Mycobacteroides abscessus subsp. abscessus]SIN24851.1 Uncharacterised protein [Mycobacteroides abscessus subsp. abscessus]SLI52100.1 Uncharacterised protein [Mycobacteroides abscessus subsp. abscessus]